MLLRKTQAVLDSAVPRSARFNEAAACCCGRPPQDEVNREKNDRFNEAAACCCGRPRPPPVRHWSGSAGFNEAAACCCGRPDRPAERGGDLGPASMRPQRVAAEDPCSSYRSCRSCTCFNEAAACCCGRPSAKPPFYRNMINGFNEAAAWVVSQFDCGGPIRIPRCSLLGFFVLAECPRGVRLKLAALCL